MSTRAGVLLLILAMGAGASTAPQRPAGDAPPAAPRVVRGQVRSDDDSATLLRRVKVAIVGDTAAPAFSDQQGRFEVEIPDAGDFTLRFTKPGFAVQQVSTARLGPDFSLQIRLTHGAAIVGRVIDESGSPAVDVGVRVRGAGAAFADAPFSASTRTDDLGEFRVGSLPAGRYEVAVENNAPLVTINRDGTSGSVTMRVAPPPPPPAPPQCDPGTSAECGDLVARFAARAAAEPPPSVVQLRPGDEVGVVLVHEAGAAALRSARSYADGFEAGSQAGVNNEAARLQSRGSGTLTGRVNGPGGGPVPGALVRLTPVTPGLPTRVVASGADGTFQLTGVPAGTYRLAASRNGFIAGEYGQVRAGDPGTLLAVRDRDRLTRVDVALSPGAVIAGTVTDMEGEPIEGLAMQVWRAHSRDGRPVAETVTDTTLRHTDDRGRYRIHGLQPGTYYVVAADDPAPPGTGGRVTGLRGAPRAFYPGVSTLAQSVPVRIDIGIDAIGADLAFAAARTFRISGHALDAGGEPVTWPVSLSLRSRPGAVVMPPYAAPVSFDGAFEFTHVPPGQYVIQAFQLAGREFGLGIVDVTDADVGPLRINATPMATISGRILLMGEQPDLATRNVRLDVLTADPDYLTHNALPRASVFRVNPDWTFEMEGLAGPIRFVSADTPAGWWLEAVNIGGVNAADEPVRFSTAEDSRAGVEIVFSNRGAEISGRAVGSRNEPVATYMAVAFPVDRERWYSGSRYVKTASPNQQGRFTLPAMPPGDYFVATVDALPEGALQDFEVMGTLSTLSRRMTVFAGERLETDLPLLHLPAFLR